MKPVFASLVALAAVGLAGQALASQELAKSKNCMGCHAVERKMVGPAYKDVAAKYKGDKKAAEALAATIKAGGAGKWGPVPMPPNNVTDDEAKKLAHWVLSL